MNALTPEQIAYVWESLSPAQVELLKTIALDEQSVILESLFARYTRAMKMKYQSGQIEEIHEIFQSIAKSEGWDL